MKICIPCDFEDLNSMVSESFGRSNYYLIFNTENDESVFVINTASNSQGGAGVKAAQIVVNHEVDALITPQLGENASIVLEASKIRIYKSREGTLMENILAFNSNKLDSLKEIHQGYHDHR